MLEPREYSKRLGVLTHRQLQAALDRFDLGELIEASSAPSGLFGQNVLLDTTHGAYVLRGAPHTDYQFAKERYFAKMIHECARVPAPWPYLIDDDAGPFGWPYAIMPRLPGEQLQDPATRGALSDGDRFGIARAMGEALALLQEATWPVHAWYDIEKGELAPLEKPYAEWYADWTGGYWLDRCRAASNATTEDDAAWVRSVIEQSMDALAVPFVPAIVHTDFTEGNIVAERDGADAWRVSGIFDLMDLYMGDGDADLARLYAYYRASSPERGQVFLDAYFRVRPKRERFEERLRMFILHDRLIFWEYGQRNKVWFKDGVTFREWAEPIVDMPIGTT
jgi:aminoglycoside phosphotransferase (APT) family kinase protein